MYHNSKISAREFERLRAQRRIENELRYARPLRAKRMKQRQIRAVQATGVLILLVFVSAFMVGLLSSCTHAPAPDSADGKAIATTLSVWRAAGLPTPKGRCTENITVVRDSDYAAFKAACKNPFAAGSDPRILTGCTTRGFSKLPWRNDPVFDVRIAPGNPHEHTTIMHETLHVLMLCTGLDTDRNGDALHTDPRVWEGVGGASSVESTVKHGS